jgi:hypothetical protein
VIDLWLTAEWGLESLTGDSSNFNIDFPSVLYSITSQTHMSLCPDTGLAI